MNPPSKRAARTESMVAVVAGASALAGAVLAIVSDDIRPNVILVLALATAALAVVAVLAGRQMQALHRALAQTEGVRQQALALAQCMKDLTRRLSALEAPAMPIETAAPVRPDSPLAVTDRMEMPDAAAHAERFRFGAASLALPPTLQVDAPEQRRNIRVPPAIRLERIVNLPHRRLVGYALNQEGEVGEGEAVASELLEVVLERLQATERTAPQSSLLVGFGSTLASAPQTLARLERRLIDMPRWRSRLLIGIAQADIQAGGEDQARAIGRLSALGVGFCLTELTRFALDCQALRACGFRQVRVDAARLISALNEDVDLVERMGRALAGEGLLLVADGVGDARLIPELIDLGVAQISGSAVETSPAAIPQQRMAG